MENKERSLTENYREAIGRTEWWPVYKLVFIFLTCPLLLWA